MQVPFHPLVVHLPLALTVILPVLIFVFAGFIFKNKLPHQTWLVIIGLQLLTTVSGYVALESGEDEEHQVERVVDKKIIHQHEERAEVFVGATVVTLVLSIAAYFLQRQLQLYVNLFIGLLSLVCCYLAYLTGGSGGELVYRHGAASAYIQVSEPDGLLPTPGMNTSESTAPVDENESLKADDNDYGDADEATEPDEEDKQED